MKETFLNMVIGSKSMVKETINLEKYCFIFDIDGTLLDLRKIWEKFYQQMYREKCGFTLTKTEIQSLFGPPELEAHTALLKRRKMYSIKLAATLVLYVGRNMPILLEKTNLKRFLLPGVLPFLHYLQKHKATIAVYTGNLPSICHLLLGNSGLEPYFETVACAAATTRSRDETLQQVLGTLRQNGKLFSKSTILVLGDSVQDIKTAKSIGVISVGVATGHYSLKELREARPD